MAEYSTIDQKGNCIFCSIGSGEIPPIWNATIYEDDKYKAWLAPYPNTEWFAVVIPKEHFGSDVLAMPDDALQEFVLAAKKVAHILESYYDDVWRVGLMMEWTWVDHAHIKLFPMHDTAHMKQWVWKQYLWGGDTYFKKYEWWMSSNDWSKADEQALWALAQRIRGSY